MAAIKKFFEKKKLDMKFKKAGGGVRLGDESTGPPQQTKSPVPQGSKAVKSERAPPSDSAEKARQAALLRLQHSQAESTSKFGTSSAAIKAKVKKEMEEEAKQKEMSENYRAPTQPVQMEAAPVAHDSVLFSCPIIGSQVLPKAELEAEIKRFLYSQLEEEPQLTAALMVHTLTKDKEKVRLCVETLCRYLDNIIQNPDEPKYRKIRVANTAFQQRVASCEGSRELLTAAGYESTTENDEEFLIMSEEAAKDSGALIELKEALLAAEAIRPELDRGLRVFHPNSRADTFGQLPPEFFTISAEELKREQMERQQAVEKLGMLRTKAMRERDEQRQKRKYRYTLIRVRIPPHGLLLQATFRVHEPFSAVLQVIRDALVSEWLPFSLCTATGQKLDEQEDLSLVDLELVPASLLTMTFDQEVIEQVRRENGSQAEELLGLKPELLVYVKDL